MTLHIVHSNRVERLHDELAYLIHQHPLSHPFMPETIVCPSQAMARWVNLRFAAQQGIAAHFDYPLPSSWIWQLASALLPDIEPQEPLQRDVMAWQVFHHLTELDGDAGFTQIKRYLSDDNDATKRWALAQKIAFTFERYTHYRPDIIEQWNRAITTDEAHQWQATLWQKLKQDNDIVDRVELLMSLAEYLQASPDLKALPERVCFFSLSALPPLLLKNIQLLAQFIDVYFFVLSPSDQYWSDLVSLKQQAKQRLKQPEHNDYYTTGHELLASWGQQGKVFQDMLLNELNDQNTQYYEAYESSPETTLLAQLQASLLDLSDDKIIVNSDESIKINRCHSALRECEVLHDQCLTLLQDNNLKPEDILVIVPNIQDYAATIEAVFGKSYDQKKVKPFIPWNLSDTSLQSESPLKKTFLALLSLPTSRFSNADVLTLLACPAIARRFDLSEHDLEVINDYIRQAQINWGIDSEFKTQFNLPATEQNTWQKAKQRFFTAYAVQDDEFWNDIFPLAGFSSSRAQSLVRFFTFMDSLVYYRSLLSAELSMQQWQKELNQLIERFFKPEDDEQDILQAIREVIDELVEQSHWQGKTEQPRFKIDLVKHYLSDYFEQKQHSSRYFSGGVTFCGMRPMRSLAFKVIVMLGMNERDFPRTQHPLEFDLMAEKWRPGDLMSSDEDRYLFLETLLCARQTLIISYCAKDLNNNTELEPSHLVSELCDYLNTYFLTESQSPLVSSISTDYPMHSFNENNYLNQSGHYKSYNQYWCDIANSMRFNSVGKPATLKLAEPVEESEKTLDGLITCLKDPLKYFFTSQLHIRLFAENELKNDECFHFDALQQWGFKHTLLTQAGLNEEPSLHYFSAQDRLPHGAHAQASYQQAKVEVDQQLQHIEHYFEHSADTVIVAVDLAEEDIHLSGQIEGFYQDYGLLQLSASRFGHKDFIACWIKHLALCAFNLMTVEQSSVLLFKDKQVRFECIPLKQAKRSLESLLQLFNNASKKPLLIINQCSFIYQYHVLLQSQDEQAKKPYEAALDVWHGNEVILGEKAKNESLRLAFYEGLSKPEEMLNSPDFINNAHALYAEAFAHAHIQDLTS